MASAGRRFLVSAAVASLALGDQSAIATDNRSPGTVFRDCETCPEMVVVPAGSFLMGEEGFDRIRIGGGPLKETPVHEVTFSRPFAIARYETKVGEFGACIHDGACDDVDAWSDRNPKQNQPRTFVNWNDAVAYTDWLSKKTGRRYRLPSEAEWEYAARGGTTTRYWWGDDFRMEMANCWACSDRPDPPRVSEGGTFPPNPFGIYDVSGNLSEWTLDCWHPSYDNAPPDGSARTDGNCSLRPIRGGSLGADAEALRVAHRDRLAKTPQGNTLGFRLVRELE